MPEWQISTIDADLYLYRVSKGLPQINDSGSYLTGLAQCGVGRTASAIATTRQLLVGLKDVEILKKERVMFNGEGVHFSRIKAKLDDHLLDIICLSFRHENCVNDIVIWNNKNTTDSLVEYLSSAEPEKLVAFIADFPEILTR
jgi:hypothetical protein